MPQIKDKFILLLLSFSMLLSCEDMFAPVMIMLVAIIISSLMQTFGNGRLRVALGGFYVALCLLVPDFVILLPLVFYDCNASHNRFLIGSAVFAMVYNFFLMSLSNVFLLAGLMGLAMLTCRSTSHYEKLRHELIITRDNSTELNLLLKSRNKDLIERQDYEIYLATLKERNRIAREIHDNVGHMLSRSILQVAAMIAINNNEDEKQMLTSVKDTLNSVMTSIRESVHYLHDDSVDLEQAVLDILKPMRDSYDINTEFDMGKTVPSNVKLCFISTVKEAASNIIRHSNCSQINVIIREHPAFYQLAVEDNGTNISKNTDGGIGLINMRERAEKLDGIFRFTIEKGFKIFMSVPKNGRVRN